MLLVSLASGARKFALEAHHVVQILPQVALHASAQTHPLLCGALNYQGRSLAVTDLGLLLGATASKRSMGTRLLVLNLSLAREATAPQTRYQFGLLAEEVTSVIKDRRSLAPTAALQQSSAQSVRYLLSLEQLLPASLLPVLQEEQSHVLQ